MNKYIVFLALLATLLIVGCKSEVTIEEPAGTELVEEPFEVTIEDIEDDGEDSDEEETEEEVEQKPEIKDDSQKDQAQDKMDDMKDVFKDLRDYITELKQRNGDFDDAIAEAEQLQDSARDLREQAEMDFEAGNYADAIKNADIAIDIADKYVDIEEDQEEEQEE